MLTATGGTMNYAFDEANNYCGANSGTACATSVRGQPPPALPLLPNRCSEQPPAVAAAAARR